MKRTRRVALALLLALCVTLGLLPALTPAANAADAVTYLDATVGADNTVTFTEKTCDSCVAVASGLTTWNAGWYVVNSDVTIASRITVTGDVRLILANGCTLTASKGITVTGSNSLTIYAQSTGDSMGRLSATSGDSQAGIGGGYNGAGGTITINGGAVTATGGEWGAGIGGGCYGAGGTITVNGGAVTATGGAQGAGIGGGKSGVGGTITVNGGAVTANGGKNGAGIGGGYKGASGAISITGGTVAANGNVGGTSNDGGAGIGGGENGDNSATGNSISITGGTVTATVPNGTKGAAIGNGGGDSGTDVTVTIGAGLTVGAGTSADGTGATSTTAADVANNKSYKYAKIPFAAVPLDPVSYLDWDDAEKKLVEKKGDDACKDYALVTANDTAWSGTTDNPGWYVVNSDVTIASRITVTGDVRLILANGCTLTASKGITVTGSNSLTIYAQSTGDSMGRLSATGGEYGAGIGGCNGAGGVITINGGAVTANGGDYGAGIGGCNGAGGTITVNGGAVTANGGDGGAGIGGGYEGASGAISITGGTVNANGNVGGSGGGDGAGIGGGESGNNSGDGNSISITGGTVTATVPNGTKGAAIGNGGGSSGTNVNSVTIGAGATVEAGTSADGTGAEVKTDAPNNKDYKYAKITFAAAPSYTVTAADTVTETDKKYHYNEDITIAVTVSGADFEGGEFTLTYDSNTLAVKTLPTNNLIATSGQEAGKVKFEAQEKTTKTNGTALAVIVFTVNAKVTTETTCNFTFEGTPKICYDTGKNSVEAATVTNGRVTVEPVTFDVTLTPNPSDFTLTGNNGVDSVDNAKAIDGQDYSVTIGNYSATDYEYAVTLAVAGTTGTTTLTPSDAGVITVGKDNITGNLTVTVTRTTKHVTATLEGGLLSGSTDAIKGVDYTATISDYDANNYTYAVTLTMNNASADDKATMSGGTITIDGDDITGDFTLTVTKTLANFTVTTTADYVTGWTLVTVAKTAANNGSPVYKYAGNDMYYVEAYSAYAYLVNVEGGVTVADATANVTLGDTEAVTIAAGYDVNNTGKVDYSDTLLTYRCYEKVHQTPATAMETYLRADVNNSKKVDTEDVSAIDENRTPEN